MADVHCKQVLRVKSTMGWSYEFSLRPSSDLALYDKYNIAEYLQVRAPSRASTCTMSFKSHTAFATNNTPNLYRVPNTWHAMWHKYRLEEITNDNHACKELAYV